MGGMRSGEGAVCGVPSACAGPPGLSRLQGQQWQAAAHQKGPQRYRVRVGAYWNCGNATALSSTCRKHLRSSSEIRVDTFFALPHVLSALSFPVKAQEISRHSVQAQELWSHALG